MRSSPFGKSGSGVVNIQRTESAAGDEDLAIRRRANMTASKAHVFRRKAENAFLRTKAILSKYAKFVGPGFMVAVAYIDPGV